MRKCSSFLELSSRWSLYKCRKSTTTEAKANCMDPRSFRIQFRETNLKFFSSFSIFEQWREHSDEHRLFKLKPLLKHLVRFKSVYTPGSTVTIDETIVPWWGRLSFIQYISEKVRKYSVTIYKLASRNGYTWNFIIYTGNQDSMPGLGHSQTVILSEDLLGCYRTVVSRQFLYKHSSYKAFVTRGYIFC